MGNAHSAFSSESAQRMNPGNDLRLVVQNKQRSGSVEAPSSFRYRFFFHGNGSQFAWLIFKNQLLGVLTFGLYFFWGKVAMRRYVAQNSEFNGSSLEYSGTGRELWFGAIKFSFILLLAQLVLGIFFRASASLLRSVSGGYVYLLMIAIAMAGLIGGLWVLGYGEYAAKRFYLSRTSWKGISLGLHPHNRAYANLFCKNRILSILTLGFYYPIARNKEFKFRMNHMYIGSLAFRYSGKDKEVFHLFLKYFPLILLTVGIGFIWYQAELKKYRAYHTWIGSTELGAARGHLMLSGTDLFLLYLLNSLCVVVTLGFAIPWVFAHNYSFQMERFSFVGQVNFNDIQPQYSSGDAMGDFFASSMLTGYFI